MAETLTGPSIEGTDPEGTWLVAVPLRTRAAKFAVRMGIASALTAWLFYEQFQSNAPAPYMVWGFAVFAVGTFLGVRAFGIKEVRVYATTVVRYTHAERLQRSYKWFLLGVAMVAVPWGMQSANNQLAEYWWYTWPALLPLGLALRTYLQRSEAVLSGAGQYARAQDDERRKGIREARNARVGELLESGPMRYLGAAICAYLSYELATDTKTPNSGWAALGLLAIAFVLARELGMWLLGIALFVGIAWALIAGISALPVSAAIIIGALIIAGSISKGR